MQVKIGPHEYRVILVKGTVRNGMGEAFCGLTHFDQQYILISGDMEPSKRLSTLWHELVHAFLYELNITDTPVDDEESMCNLIGLAMSHLDAVTIAKLHVYMTEGVECDGVMMSPRLKYPVAVLDTTGT
ncbi:hypothetical protein [Poriferisphaera sp. WC338]|uniref:hypothetical protein n=1 Tax=Poriferisphaera sp. WC338 TaxID=3425129 RepID=UPI003D81839F